MARQLGERLLAGAHDDHAMSVALQRDAHDVGDAELVFDDEHRGHGPLPFPGAACGPSAC